MKTLLTIIIGLLLPLFVIAQEDTAKFQEEELIIFGGPEKMPEFPGGFEALLKYINTKVAYTERAIKEGVKGTVYLTFLIEKSGKINDVKILRGIHPDLDSIALKIVNEMPVWIPAANRDEPVDCQYNLPIKFDFQGQGTPETPTPSKYWEKRGKRKFYNACEEEYRMTQEECDCWYQYVIHKYNGLKLESIDLEVLFQKEVCK